ncbi:SRPBCC family protein [Pedococcus sp.]|jgi:carbon monoxide dehydrogenase subunit G|uniref:SRPBCC family protein n=1 Tax=Pedococcus sp. TaxID=2860345 RepID=UPI002E113DDF|nr:SRPBCC family protein [Pedococcus sp.]
MTDFTASKRSTAEVPFARDAVWQVLTDARQVARLTPMVRSIEPHDDLWVWKLAPIEVLGRSVGLSFTEQMTFTPQERIVYTHTPASGERAGVEGTYVLASSGQGTRLTIDLGVSVDLPFPRLARPAVQTSMHAVIAAMGAGFAHNLDRHLRSRG